MIKTECYAVGGAMVTASWDATPAAGRILRDLGDGVTIVDRDAPGTAGAVWVAPYAVNCTAHGRLHSRATASQAASDGFAHLASLHSPAAAGWDEPAGATSPRGWLMRTGTCTGFYLDYGPDHYRVSHQSDVGCGRLVSFCTDERKCRECQPGNVLAVRYPAGPGTATESRYCVTADEARRYVAGL